MTPDGQQVRSYVFANLHVATLASEHWARSGWSILGIDPVM